jgi:DNA-binding protein H-NS
MRSLAEVQAQINELNAEAETIRKAQIAQVLEEIKAKMVEYNISTQDLDRTVKKPVKSKSNTPAKYKGPNGELWAGGLGRKPQWVRDLAAQNKDLEDYRI